MRSSAVKENFDPRSERVRILFSLFEANCNDRDPRLTPVREIKKVYVAHAQEFSLERFQQKILLLVRRWAGAVLPVPELSILGYGSSKSEGVTLTPLVALGQTENMDRLQQRECTMHRTDGEIPRSSKTSSGDDPRSLSGGEAEAGENTHVFKRKRVNNPLDHLYESNNGGDWDSDESVTKTLPFRKKNSAHRLSFLSDEVDESEGEKPQVIQVSRKPSIGKRRSRFTEEEDEAIKEGVDNCGFGNWAEIKAEYCTQLKDRSTVQIKDRARTLGI